MKVAVVMRTIDRSPRRNFLGKTLGSFARSGVFESDHFASMDIVDSGSPDPLGYFEYEAAPHVEASHDILVHHGEELTPNACATRAHEAALIRDSDWVLFCEDDINVCGRFLDSVALWLADHADPSYPLYSFGANYVQVSEFTHQGRTCWPYPVDSFYGSQCYAVSAEANRELVPWLADHPLPSCAPPGCDERGHDLRLQDWGRDRDAEFFLATVPSFIDHIGYDTAMGCRFYTFRSWPGPDWSYQPEAVAA